MGDRVNFQDGALIHGAYDHSVTKIGHDVSIGHNAIVYGCRGKDRVLIGMGCIIIDDCVVESNSIIDAGSVFAVIHAKKTKEISPEWQKEENERIAANYIQHVSRFK